MICPECNHPNMENANHCVICGNRLDNDEPDGQINQTACPNFRFFNLFSNVFKWHTANTHSD